MRTQEPTGFDRLRIALGVEEPEDEFGALATALGVTEGLTPLPEVERLIGSKIEPLTGQLATEFLPQGRAVPERTAMDVPEYLQQPIATEPVEDSSRSVSSPSAWMAQFGGQVDYERPSYAEDIKKSTRIGLERIPQAVGTGLKATARAMQRQAKIDDDAAPADRYELFGQGTSVRRERGRQGTLPPEQQVGRSNPIINWMEDVGGGMADRATERIEAIPMDKPENLAQWVAQTIPQGLLSTVPSMIGAAVGTAVAGPLGGVAGALGPSFLLNWHEALQTLQESGEGYEGLNEDDAAGIAVLVAAPMAALDAFMPARLVGKWTGTLRQNLQKTLVKRVASEIAKNATLEGITEGLQNVVRQIATLGVTGRPVDVAEIIEDIAAGALIGGIVGGGGQVYTEASGRNADLTPEQERAQRDRLAAERAYATTPETVEGARRHLEAMLPPESAPPMQIETERDVAIRRGMEAPMTMEQLGERLGVPVTPSEPLPSPEPVVEPERPVATEATAVLEPVGRELTPEEVRLRNSGERDPLTGALTMDPMDRPTYERRMVEGQPPSGTPERRVRVDLSAAAVEIKPHQKPIAIEPELVQEFRAIRTDNLAERSDAALQRELDRLRSISSKLEPVAVASERGEKVGEAGKFLRRVMGAQDKIQAEVDARSKARSEVTPVETQAPEQLSPQTLVSKIEEVYGDAVAKDQYDFRLAATDASGQRLGTVDVSDYLGDPTIKMIEVDPAFRRQGVGRALMEEVQRRYPGQDIARQGTFATPEGRAFREAVMPSGRVVAVEAEPEPAEPTPDVKPTETNRHYAWRSADNEAGFEWVSVPKGRAVDIAGFEDLDTFVHRASDVEAEGKGWVVTDARTGTRVSPRDTQYQTKEQAIDAATEKLQQTGRENVDAAMVAWESKYGSSPTQAVDLKPPTSSKTSDVPPITIPGGDRLGKYDLDQLKKKRKVMRRMIKQDGETELVRAQLDAVESEIGRRLQDNPKTGIAALRAHQRSIKALHEKGEGNAIDLSTMIENDLTNDRIDLTQYRRLRAALERRPVKKIGIEHEGKETKVRLTDATDEQLIAHRETLIGRMGKDVNKARNMWVRDDENIQAVRVGTPHGAARAQRRINLARGVIDAIDLELEARGIDIAESEGRAQGGAPGISSVPFERSAPYGVQQAAVAYHGSPHEFEQFSTDYARSGEGSAYRGEGLYFGEAKATGEFYRDRLERVKTTGLGNVTVPKDSEAGRLSARFGDDGTKWTDDNGASITDLANDAAVDVYTDSDGTHYRFSDDTELIAGGDYWDLGQLSRGHLYEVLLDIEQEQLLDWDKPIVQQPAKVRSSLNSLLDDNMDVLESVTLGDNIPLADDADFTAGEAYMALARAWGNKGEVSDELSRRGVKGVRFLDQLSRDVLTGIATTEAMLADAEPGSSEYTEISEELSRLQDQDLTNNYVIFDATYVQISGVSEPQAQSTFGTPEAASEAAQMAVAANKVRTLDERLAVVAQEPTAQVDIVGKRIASADDTAVVIRPFRSPKTEKLTFLLLNDDGVVVAYQTYSSGALNYVNLEGVWDEVVRQLMKVAESASGTELVLVHNHPSGDSKPSSDDVDFTNHIAESMRAAEVPLKFRRHYVIDNDNVSEMQIGSILPAYMKPDKGSMQVLKTKITKIEPVRGKMPDWTQGNRKAHHAKAVVQLVGGAPSRQVDVLYRDAGGRAIALVPHGIKEARNPSAWMNAEAKSLGARDAILIVDKRQTKWVDSLVDAISQYETASANTSNVEIRDVIAIDSRNGEWESAIESGRFRPVGGAFGRSYVGQKPATKVAEGQTVPTGRESSAAVPGVAGVPADEAAVQGGLFGEDALVGGEQAEMFGTNAGRQRQNLRRTKIQPDETKRLIDERGAVEPKGERSADLFTAEPDKGYGSTDPNSDADVVGKGNAGIYDMNAETIFYGETFLDAVRLWDGLPEGMDAKTFLRSLTPSDEILIGVRGEDGGFEAKGTKLQTVDPTYEITGPKEHIALDDISRLRVNEPTGPYGNQRQPDLGGDLLGEPRQPDLDELLSGVKAPPRAGPPKAESRPAARKRLTHARNLLVVLADHIGTKKRVVLGDPFRAQIAEIVEGVLVPKRVQFLLDSSLDAKTHLQAHKVVERARKIVEDELHRRAVDDLQHAYQKALGAKMRPEFLSSVEATVEDIDFKAMSPKTRRALRATAKYLEHNPDSPIPESVRRDLGRLDLKLLKEMSFEEIQDITDAVSAAIHLNRVKNKLLGRQRKRTRDVVAAQTISEMTERMPELKRGRRRGLEGPPTRGQVGLLLKEVGTRPEVLVEALSDELRQLIWEDITVQGHHVEQRAVWQFRDALTGALAEQDRSIGTRAFEKWRSEPLQLQTPEGPVQISRDEAMWLLTTIKDPSNLSLMYRKGVTIERSDRNFSVDDSVIESLEGITGDTEKNVAKFLHEQFNGPMKDALNKAWVEVFGYEIARVPDYAPRSIDMTRAETGKDPIEQMAADREAALTTWGHLRERVGAGAPIRIGGALDTYLNHADHVARLSAYLAPATNAHAIVGRKDVKQAMIQRIGREGYDRILDSIRMQTVKFAETSHAGRWMRLRLRMFGGSVLGVRATTWFLNPSGLPVSAAYQEDGFANLAKSLTSGVNPKEWQRVIGLAKKYSPYWRSRYNNFVHETISGLGADRSRSYGPRGITEIGLEPLQKSDQFGAIIRWRMAEHHIDKTQPSLEKSGDAYYEEVALEWERLMFRGENTGHGGDYTGAIAYGRRNAAFAPFVMFTSSVSKIYSVGVRARLQVQRGDVKGATRSFAGLALALLWAATVREGFRKMRGRDDDDENLSASVAKRMTKDVVSYVPVLGPTVLAPLVGKVLQGSSFAYPASVTESMLNDMRVTSVGVVKTIQKALDDELTASGEKAYLDDLGRAIEGTLQLGAAWFGVPWGWQDIPRAVDRLMPDDPDLRALVREIEGDANVLQENRHLLAAIRDDNTKEFRRAIETLVEKEKRPTFAEIVSVVNRKYGYLTKYEPGKTGRNGKKPEFLEMVDLAIVERDELRERARQMAQLNSDVLERSASPRSTGRPRRSKRRR